MVGVKLEWDDVAENAEGKYPRIEGDTFYTKPSTTCEEATLWLFKQLENKLKETKPSEKRIIEEEKKTYKKNPFRRWKI